MKIETYDNWKIITERNSLTYLNHNEKLNGWNNEYLKLKYVLIMNWR